MIDVIRRGLVIARRDFMAVVATPTFVLFLLAPFLMIGLSVGSGLGGVYLAKGTESNRQLVAIVSPADGARMRQADEALVNRIYGPRAGPPPLRIVNAGTDPVAQQAAILASKEMETVAVLRGPLDRPIVTFQKDEDRMGRYLALLAEEVLRNERLGGPQDVALSKPEIREIKTNAPIKSRQQGTGTGTVVIMFMLTIMLASQSLGTMAEEKSNKIVEILAAAIPLESVFFGKLIGLLGIAIVFIAFWGGLAALGLSIVPASVGLSTFEPVIGLPLYIAFAALYFAMAFMLLGAIFLGLGAQASTMREIQLLSLPATVFQLAMFGLGMAAAGNPGSGVATFARIFPFSSPFAMAARGATDGAVWPHLVALAWQGLWVGITIWIASYLYRYGVLKSGVGPLTAIKRRFAGRAVA